MSAVAIAVRLFNYFTAVALLSYGVYLYGGYTSENWWSTDYKQRPHPSSMQAFRDPSNAKASAEVGYEVYRGDNRRTGFFDKKVSLKLKLQNKALFRNVGIHGASKASPLAIGNEFIIATDVGDLARITPDEKLLWHFRTTKSKDGLHSTPLFVDGQVIAGDYSGLLMSFNSQTGQMIWGLPLGNSVGASPLVTVDKKILISVETTHPDGFIAKVDLLTGKIEWLSSYLGNHGHSSVALQWNAQDPESSVLLFGDNSPQFSAIDYGTGQWKWRQNVGGPIKSTPALSEDTAYVASWDGYLYAFDIATGKIQWKKEFEEKNQSSVALSPDGKWGLISGRKGLCRFSLDANAEKIICTQTENSQGTRKSSPVITRSYSNETPATYIVWTPCKQQSICAYDLQLKLLKEWDVGSPVSGEIRPYKNGVMALSEGSPGLILLVSEY